MKFALCVPTYNEESIILDTIFELSNILDKLSKNIQWQIIIADNGSSDKTRELVASLKTDNVSVMSILEKGKGIAISNVSKNIDADFFGFIDADLSADPKIIPEMLNYLIFEKFDVVIGSRFSDKTLVSRGYFRSASSKIFNFLQSFILGIQVSDTQCGIKLMNRQGVEILKICEEKTWFLDLEFLAYAELKKLKIVEVPVRWNEFRYKNRKSKLRVWQDGFSAIIAMFRVKMRVNNI